MADLYTAVLNGITRDQMMARHKSNHIGWFMPRTKNAHRVTALKPRCSPKSSLTVHFCGDVDLK